MSEPETPEQESAVVQAWRRWRVGRDSVGRGAAFAGGWEAAARAAAEGKGTFGLDRLATAIDNVTYENRNAFVGSRIMARYLMDEYQRLGDASDPWATPLPPDPAEGRERVTT